MYLASAKKILVERDQMGIEWPPVFLLKSKYIVATRRKRSSVLPVG